MVSIVAWRCSEPRDSCCLPTFLMLVSLYAVRKGGFLHLVTPGAHRCRAKVLVLRDEFV